MRMSRTKFIWRKGFVHKIWQLSVEVFCQIIRIYTLYKRTGNTNVNQGMGRAQRHLEQNDTEIKYNERISQNRQAYEN